MNWRLMGLGPPLKMQEWTIWRKDVWRNDDGNWKGTREPLVRNNGKTSKSHSRVIPSCRTDTFRDPPLNWMKIHHDGKGLSKQRWATGTDFRKEEMDEDTWSIVKTKQRELKRHGFFPSSGYASFRLGFSSSPFILTERELLLVTAEPELCVGCWGIQRMDEETEVCLQQTILGLFGFFF